MPSAGRARRLSVPAAALIVLVVLVLAACADAEPAPTAESTQTASESPSQTATATAEPETEIDLTEWEISSRGIGPFEVGMDVAEVSALTGVDYTDVADTTATCVEFPLSYEPTLSHLSGLAESGGYEGTVDTFTVFDWQFEGIDTPTTAEGLGLRSTLDEVAAVYGDALQTAPWSLDPAVTRAWTIGDDGLGIQFLVDSEHGVFEIAVGREPQVTYETGCMSAG